MASFNGFIARVMLAMIGFYRRAISPMTPPSCRFVPTCSHYTYDAIQRFGAWRGGWLGVRRLCRCHPFHRGGFDPVPLEWGEKPLPHEADVETKSFDSQT